MLSAEGRVSLAFRRWRKAPPKDGSTLRTPAGVVSLDRVTVIEVGDISADDVARTGMSVAELRASIAGEGTLLRVEIRLIGDDPRVALRETRPAAEEISTLAERLRRMDAAADAPWTAAYLRVIADQPAVVARRLASSVRIDVATFKRRVRRLKELGLTESLEVGYRLSPRGEALLASIGRPLLQAHRGT